jgi:4-amino-4-deoxy-L-arabinose transferase-like glycosyltransferase
MKSEFISPSPQQSRRLPLLLLILTALFIFFFRLGGRGFENKDTIWYVEIAWEMLRSGDWIVPRFNTVIFTEKPILFIWAVAGLSRIAGAITPFISRLPSALAAFGCTFLTVWLGKTLFNRRTGLLSGFILCTSYAFAWEGRACMVDMLFTFFVTLSLCFLYRGFSREGTRKGPFILAYVTIGLAALTKGPLGIVLPAVVCLAFLVVDRKLKLIRSMMIPLGILIVIGMQAAWYVPYLVKIGPEGRRFFYEMYVYKENLLRFTSGFDHYEPFWFYGPEILSHFLPWSPFLILCLFASRLSAGGGIQRDRRFPAAWFLSVLAFLTISSGKHSRYALPLYPAAALLVADFWDRVFDKHKWRACFIAIVGAFTIGWACYLIVLPAYDEKRAEHQRLAEDVAPVVGNDQLATYGPTAERFGRRLALGFFLGACPSNGLLGKPVIYIDREKELLDYLRADRRVFCLMETAVYEQAKGRIPQAVKDMGRFRYRDMDLILLSNH